jgi:hypothetical protein
MVGHGQLENNWRRSEDCRVISDWGVSISRSSGRLAGSSPICHMCPPSALLPRTSSKSSTGAPPDHAIVRMHGAVPSVVGERTVVP